MNEEIIVVLGLFSSNEKLIGFLNYEFVLKAFWNSLLLGSPTTCKPSLVIV